MTKAYKRRGEALAKIGEQQLADQDFAAVKMLNPDNENIPEGIDVQFGFNFNFF
jgi:hypothetical protein